MNSSTHYDDVSQKSSTVNDSADDNKIPEYHGFDKEVSSEVQNLARMMSRPSIDKASSLARTLSNMSQVPGLNPMAKDEGELDPRLDPDSDSFDSKFWVKNLRKMHNSDPAYYKPASLGVAYKDLRAYGIATDADYQANVGNVVYKTISQTIKGFFDKNNDDAKFDILKPMDGLIRPGEVTVVLGRPGAGCSTFLKTISSNTHGFTVAKDSVLSYDGLKPNDIIKHFRGDVVYCAETESHFPQLTVGQTLDFAAKLRTPQNRPEGVSREEYAAHMTKVIMATYGLSHTRNTKVGNDFIRGVSGGERKRVSIAEVALSFASLQCWDNSTRGLDSATALEFIKALKTSATVLNATPMIAIYQCSQDAYDLFDKVILLYEGYQIFFGDCKQAKLYFLEMGYDCPQRQTTADFLTSLTNPSERVVRPGYENKVPRTPEEFYTYWQNSPERKALLGEIDDYLNKTDNEERLQQFKDAHNTKQSNHLRPASPYTVSYGLQVKYIMGRNIMRTKGDPSITLFSIFGNTVMGLIISSIFYNLDDTTGSFYYRTVAMFFAVLFNAFSSLLEIFALYEARPIVEKHKTYALYHPSADAFASIITELPPKLLVSISFNLVLYFMVNFRRNAGNFFFYLLVNFTATLSMSHLFRTIGSATKSLSQAMTPASVLLLALTIFTGFVIPTPEMLGWCRWINYLDPIGYAFEALIANEFHGRDFDCSQFVPSGPGYPTSGNSIICSVVGSQPGSDIVNGDDYIRGSYEYYFSHRWRNWGIVVGFVVFFLFVHIIICEYNKGAMQKGEILLFQRSALKKNKRQRKDIESGNIEKVGPEFNNEKTPDNEIDNKLPSSGDIFHWRELTYQVKIKSEDRVILNSVDGWVKPGQVTALMGASGAGKTTLLNALSDRLTSGVITSGVRMVNGHELDASFQRSIGYVQQQDLHLQTSTVREALTFSAYLRQPKSVPKSEKDSYVDYIIRLLEMEKYSDAVVGVSGEGLNVEQRKRLTIGVELVAKPKLLVFLDEPTSGLDSQTAWSICKLIRKLADHGQAILCTIHQPSAILLKEFDRLLFLQRGGKTVYFGDLGDNCQTLIDYFEKYGAPKCPPDANPAEWMLEVIGAAPGSHASQDYYDVWMNSTEYREVKGELDVMEQELVKKPKDDSPESMKTFAVPMWQQYINVTHRVLQQYWRTPSYTYSKVLMSIFSSLFNGFAFFKANNTMQGLQNQMFSVFMFFVIFNTLTQQYLPNYVSQRDLYEARERPSKTFSWVAFITAQITAEIPWQILTGTLAFFCWYYPIGLYGNAEATDTVSQRGALMWIIIVLFFIYCSTMAQLCISFMEVADNAANLASLLFTMCLTFCGILASPDAMPGFWIFMYRCNPFSYLVSAILSVALQDSSVTCSDKELLRFEPEGGQTCGEYMQSYIQNAGGYLISNDTTGSCEYCTISSTNVFLESVSVDKTKRSRDIGIFFCFIVINMIGTVFFYWLARVPKRSRQK
ncbi:DEHA2G14894p [Debaryomyces hansenii CBS767]|uniref:DEHA2G14894p n=1 Tax=Debaryomyces hansenii (strain ATCC 36239 / CBS 767 / BCRC 21394 / JCM 1990 / NBRC 0083 / IGC 2968) TaxID=284592 RepID=Q6BHY4_DEBHA|nr:DEHA2G14894p [Debaryomyces hansenii CBS767]CAG90679.2 DEHA2G14894p [Debaryomyces hansenii CBS767]|eukprot:XP_462187.2 DEHA2G14894p [Debaryomyces hansenii CBS767]